MIPAIYFAIGIIVLLITIVILVPIYDPLQGMLSSAFGATNPVTMIMGIMVLIIIVLGLLNILRRYSYQQSSDEFKIKF